MAKKKMINSENLQIFDSLPPYAAVFLSKYDSLQQNCDSSHNIDKSFSGISSNYSLKIL